MYYLYADITMRAHRLVSLKSVFSIPCFLIFRQNFVLCVYQHPILIFFSFPPEISRKEGKYHSTLSIVRKSYK